MNAGNKMPDFIRKHLSVFFITILCLSFSSSNAADNPKMLWMKQGEDSVLVNGEGAIIKRIRAIFVLKPNNLGNYWIFDNGKYILMGRNDKPLTKYDDIYQILPWLDNMPLEAHSFSGNFYVNPDGSEFGRNYSELGKFDKQGLAFVSQKGKWGIINSKAKIIVKPIYDASSYFTEVDGKYIASVGLNKKYGFIDNNGNTIIDFKFDNARNFANGLAPVKVKDKWGFINIKGEFVIPPQYDNAQGFGFEIFNKDNAFVMVKYNDDDQIIKKWGIIDKAGNWVLKPKYQSNAFNGLIYQPEINPYGHRIINASSGDAPKKGIVDRDDKVIVPAEYQELRLYDFQKHEGQIFTIEFKKDDKWGLMDVNGATITSKLYDGISRKSYWNDSAVVKIGNKFGFINSQGEEFIKPQFDLADNFDENGFAKVVVGGKIGIIDVKGNFIIKPQFDNDLCKVMILDNYDYNSNEPPCP